MVQAGAERTIKKWRLLLAFASWCKTEGKM
jgi:hypothetical protein